MKNKSEENEKVAPVAISNKEVESKGNIVKKSKKE